MLTINDLLYKLMNAYMINAWGNGGLTTQSCLLVSGEVTESRSLTPLMAVCTMLAI